MKRTDYLALAVLVLGVLAMVAGSLLPAPGGAQVTAAGTVLGGIGLFGVILTFLYGDLE